MHLQGLLCKNNEFSDMRSFCNEEKQVLFLGLQVYLPSPLERLLAHNLTPLCQYYPRACMCTLNGTLYPTVK